MEKKRQGYGPVQAPSNLSVGENDADRTSKYNVMGELGPITSVNQNATDLNKRVRAAKSGEQPINTRPSGMTSQSNLISSDLMARSEGRTNKGIYAGQSLLALDDKRKFERENK